MKQPHIDWSAAVKPLLKKYKSTPHPLDAANPYQLMVMVVLSAQSTDKVVNLIAPELFKAFPNLRSLSKATPAALFPYISKIRNFRNKAKWLTETAKTIKSDSNIPLEIDSLIELPGIGRKSANVIRRGAKAPAEGIIVDLHTIRVANRLGIVNTTKPEKIEKEMMEILPSKEWEVGMAMSFLGREICRPTPQCPVCLMKKVCAYYNGWKPVKGK